jgi:hypothetical protein
VAFLLRIEKRIHGDHFGGEKSRPKALAGAMSACALKFTPGKCVLFDRF